MEITIGMSEIDGLRVGGLLEVGVDFGEGNKGIKMDGHEYVIDKQELMGLCENQTRSDGNSSINGEGEKVCEFRLRVSLNPSKKN